MGWPSEQVKQSWLRWLADPSLPVHPAIDRFYQIPGGSATCTRQELVTDREWRKCAFLNEVLLPDDLDEGLITRRRLPDGNEHALVLVRLKNDASFSTRDRQLLELVHDALAPHLGRSLATSGDPVAKLTKRQRAVLGCLLEGDAEKQVARRLGVAASTLHSHVKELYRHFGARSRAELMAHFLRRGWRGAATDLGHAGGPAPPPQ